ncbi:MAG: hypothetical protein D3913_06080 [Candidatus Electrothrix sp. LOE1_4_5]|nr:hypothetical protein [Candidatus Electrothrix gigas]MCI5191122.1 hypothetical protein [Candidatus Electrothrix gigas]
MKINIWSLLTDHAKWVFSGIGVLFISLIINSICSNGVEDKSPTEINISGNNSGTSIGSNTGTINTGDKVNGDKVSVLGDNTETINHEEYRDNSRKIDIKSGRDTTYIENLQPPPSFREVTVARGENGNPIGIADNPSPIQNAVGLLAKVMRGEEVNLQEASPSKFLINSGTEIAILDSDNSSEQPSTGFTDPIGFTQFVNIKILEGPYKNRTGWIHASTIHHEQRKK